MFESTPKNLFFQILISCVIYFNLESKVGLHKKIFNLD